MTENTQARRDVKITWQRPTWGSGTSIKSRIFARPADAERFAGRLREWGPVTFVHVHTRRVGEWERVS
jgi:hypothetical protein